jgi:hypothetical protein
MQPHGNHRYQRIKSPLNRDIPETGLLTRSQSSLVGLAFAAMFLIASGPERINAEQLVYHGEGRMSACLAYDNHQPCVATFDYEGPIQLEVERRPLTLEDWDCDDDMGWWPLDNVYDTYSVRTLLPVTYTLSEDGSTGRAYGRMYFEDQGTSNTCYSRGASVGLYRDFAGNERLHLPGWGGIFGQIDYGNGWVTGDFPEEASGFFEVNVTLAPTPVFGTSWDGISLQELLDAEYGPGVIDVDQAYEGFLPGDADPAYWVDFGFTSILVREIAGFDRTNTLGWYREDLTGPPVIDGTDDGVIFDGPVSDGAEVVVRFKDETGFGLYLNPNGTDSSFNAPEPELFFTNRFYNDRGPDGSGAIHPPTDGDVQCLIFNISHLRDGVPTFVVAWEDLDSGATVSPTYTTTGTDNDFNDLVIEISAFSPVRVENGTWGALKARY